MRFITSFLVLENNINQLLRPEIKIGRLCITYVSRNTPPTRKYINNLFRFRKENPPKSIHE